MPRSLLSTRNTISRCLLLERDSLHKLRSWRRAWFIWASFFLEITTTRPIIRRWMFSHHSWLRGNLIAFPLLTKSLPRSEKIWWPFLSVKGRLSISGKVAFTLGSNLDGSSANAFFLALFVSFFRCHIVSACTFESKTKTLAKVSYIGCWLCLRVRAGLAVSSETGGVSWKKEKRMSQSNKKDPRGNWVWPIDKIFRSAISHQTPLKIYSPRGYKFFPPT